LALWVAVPGQQAAGNCRWVARSSDLTQLNSGALAVVFVVLLAIENSKKDIGVNRVNKLSLG
jgi:hypothetical protein